MVVLARPSLSAARWEQQTQSAVAAALALVLATAVGLGKRSIAFQEAECECTRCESVWASRLSSAWRGALAQWASGEEEEGGVGGVGSEGRRESRKKELLGLREGHSKLSPLLSLQSSLSGPSWHCPFCLFSLRVRFFHTTLDELVVKR